MKAYMSYLDDLPRRDKNREIQEQSETVFRAAIFECEEFVIQSVLDRHDYGTDFQIEGKDAGAMTNVRVHVQLKGTGCKANADGSVSLSVKRTNLNYLAMPLGSIYVCYHAPSKRLLVRRVDDVVREYEHSGIRWSDQTTVTVKFSEDFDRRFQRRLKAHVVASARGARSHRLYYATHPPRNMSSFLGEEAIDLPVPADQTQAEGMLAELYERGHDRTISRSFDKFRAILGPSNGKFVLAYMAEINLGLNGRECDNARITEGIEVISRGVAAGEYLRGSLLYCVGNGWLAIDEYEKARDAYCSALESLDGADASHVAAKCCKNLGTTMEKLNDLDAADVFYTRALELDPNLAEAHFAFALRYKDEEPDRALEHLDAILWPANSAGTLAEVQGWRAEIFFRRGRIQEAFRDIRALLSDGEKLTWVGPWCAKLVATYGGISIEAAQGSVRFWDAYLTRFPDDVLAERERLLCVWFINTNGGRTGCDYHGFKRMISDVIAKGAPNPEFLWDRVGHWAQDDKDWLEAEKCYRKAFKLSPAEYGYCLGTALNMLGRYEEAMPMLLQQAEEHQPDAMSWFQVAVARNGIGDVKGCISAYRCALQLDENYELAWFDLGGVYWNSQNKTAAMATWKEAIRRFPTHELSSKLLRDFPMLLSSESGTDAGTR